MFLQKLFHSIVLWLWPGLKQIEFGVHNYGGIRATYCINHPLICSSIKKEFCRLEHLLPNNHLLTFYMTLRNLEKI